MTASSAATNNRKPQPVSCRGRRTGRSSGCGSGTVGVIALPGRLPTVGGFTVPSIRQQVVDARVRAELLLVAEAAPLGEEIRQFRHVPAVRDNVLVRLAEPQR